MTSSALGKLKLKTQDESRYGKIVHEGFLNKRSKGKSWRNCYAVLWEDMGLRFYESESRGNAEGKIKMSKINEIKKLSSSQSQQLDSTNPYFFAITSTQLNKTWHFGCSNDEMLSKWVHILQASLALGGNKNKKSSPKKIEPEMQETAPQSPENKYIGHIGHNMSNMEDFSVAHSMSSRASSIQSLSALQIMISQAEDDEEKDKHNHNMMDDIIEEDESQHDDDDDDFLEMEILNENYNKMGIIERLNVENNHIIFEGILERKTSQKVLGKHLWETRYFKLSTHSLSIYTNEKSDIVESVIKLSSIISVLNIKNNGIDLKNNRFDINIRDKIISLRTENEMDCQKWIHYLSQSKKKHRKSIRTNLNAFQEIRTNMKQKQFKKFKRQGSQLDMTNNNNNDENIGGDNTNNNNGKNNTHSRNLSMKSWVNGIEQKQKQNDNILVNDNNCVTTNYKFEGFLIRQVGLNGNSEKIYFRLSYDTLEFSKIDENVMNKNDINKLHNLNIMGTISVEHIKNVKMVSDNVNNKFIITFDSIFNNNNQWVLKTERNNQNYAIKWVDILQTALIDAKSIVKTINEDPQQEEEENVNNKMDNENDDNSNGDEAQQKKKQMGSLKALQQMINDETIQELEMAGNHERNSQNLDVTKDMIDLENKNRINNSGCSCVVL